MRARLPASAGSTLRSFMAAAAILVAFSDPMAAQPADAWVGLAAGGIAGSYDGPATVAFDRRTGGAVGIFAQVATPIRPLDVRVEGRLIRRGGDEVGGGGAELDLLSVPLALSVALPLGPVALVPSVGIEVAYPLADRISPDLAAGFGDPARAEVAGLVGLGLEVNLTPRLRLGLEARRVRGLGAAFEGSAGRLETRATEFVVRLARPAG